MKLRVRKLRCCAIDHVTSEACGSIAAFKDEGYGLLVCFTCKRIGEKEGLSCFANGVMIGLHKQTKFVKLTRG